MSKRNTSSAAARCSPPKTVSRGGVRKVRSAPFAADAVPPREILKELRREVAMYRRSYSEIDGVVRDEGALWTISCLKGAIRLIQAALPAANDQRSATRGGNMTDEQTAKLLEDCRWALAQSLRQWSNYANDKRHEPDDVDLGVNDELEDQYYNNAVSVLERLGAVAVDLAKAQLAARTAFDCTAVLDLLAVSWEAEAELIESRIGHDPFRTPREMLSFAEGDTIRAMAAVYRDCARDLREVVGGLASKSNDRMSAGL